MFKTRLDQVTRIFAVSLTLLAMLGAQVSLAQDNSQGRYRPDGRQIAAGISRTVGERLYEVRTYDPEPQIEEFSGVSVFYPLTLSFAPPIGAVAFVPGFRAAGDNYAWWGPMLASFGYAVFILDTNTPTDALGARKEALQAAVDFIRAENGDADSPLAGKIDTDKIALMGHSMGGGAALRAADELGADVKAVIPLLPYCCEPGQPFEGDLAGQDVPTLIIATAEDEIAPPADHARMLYESIADSTNKIYLEFTTGNHMLTTNNGAELDTQGRYAMAFLKYHVDGLPQFGDMLYGDQDAEFAAKFSRYDSSR